MPAGFTTRLSLAGMLNLGQRITSASQQNTDDAARSLQQLAAQLAPRATGSLAASIYVNNGEQSDYSACVSSAESLNPNVVIEPEIRPEFVLSQFVSSTQSDRSYTAVVGVAAGHGIYNELGTRYMIAQPFLFPASELVRAEFVNSMSTIVG